MMGRLSFVGIAAWMICLLGIGDGVARGAEATTKATTQAAGHPAEGAKADGGEKKLRVGFVVSLYTATGPSKLGRPYGYDHADIVEKLRSDQAQLIPLIESDSEDDEDMKKMIGEKFPDANGQVMRANDLESLKSLDVIVAYRTPNMRDEVLEGLTKAVEEGVGLLWVGPVGVNNPGCTDLLNNLVGLKEGQYGYGSSPVDVEVVGKDDPVMKDLDDAEKWKCIPNGVNGKYKDDVKPLVKLGPSAEIRFPFTQVDGADDFYLVYEAPLGKGCVIVCNWSGNAPEVATEEPSFYVRCFHRLGELRKK
jgi:hypothetical protein